MLKTKLKALFQNEYFPLLVLGLGMLSLHLVAPIPMGDDIFFADNINGIFDGEFLKARYLGWSSRLIIEAFIGLFLHLPLILWRVLNPLIIILLGLALSNLFVTRDKRLSNWFIVFLLFLYPFGEIFYGGWITISLNYIWPLTFGLSALVVLKKIIQGENIKVFEYILSGILLLFAANQEIMSVILLLIYLAAGGYLIHKKKLHWFVVVSFAICLLSLLFIFTTPGNSVRALTEARKFFVDFPYLSLIERLEIGLSSTLAQYYFNFNFLFFIFTLLLFLAVSHKHDGVFYKAYSLFPLFILLLFGNSIHSIVDRLFPYLAPIGPDISKYGFITLGNFTQIQSYIPLILLYISILLVFGSLYIVFENTWLSVLSIGTLLLGLLSRMVMAFSPTIFASGLRTHFLLLAATLICSVLIFEKLLASPSTKVAKNVLLFSGFAAFGMYLNQIMVST